MEHATSYDELRTAIIECLLKPRQQGEIPLSVETLYEEIAQIAKKREMKHDAGAGLVSAWRDGKHGHIFLDETWKARIWDIVWDLIIEGVVRPGTGKDNTWSLPLIHVTDFGRKALADPTTPYDPDGYLKRVRERIPHADPVIMTYLTESMETLRRNCLLSSTVTMGCASEQAMLLLMEKTEEALNPTDQVKYKGAFSKLRSIKQQNEEYQKWFDSHIKPKIKSDKGSDWVTEMENALTFLFSYFRSVRNDAGHPTGTKISREVATSHLVVFPYYLRLIYDTIEWLDAKKPI